MKALIKPNAGNRGAGHGRNLLGFPMRKTRLSRLERRRVAGLNGCLAGSARLLAALVEAGLRGARELIVLAHARGGGDSWSWRAELGMLGAVVDTNTSSRTTAVWPEKHRRAGHSVGHYTNVQVIDKWQELWGMQVPFTQSKYVFSYDGVIKAGWISAH